MRVTEISNVESRVFNSHEGINWLAQIRNDHEKWTEDWWRKWMRMSLSIWIFFCIK